MIKLKFKSDFFKSSNKLIFYKFFYKLFLGFFFIYIKLSKNLSAKYYQENKERLQKKLVKDITIFLKKKKKKSDNMVVNIIKISQKMIKINWLSIGKNMIE